MVSICAVGGTQSGKSRLLNAILKEPVLPTSAVSSSAASVLTHVRLLGSKDEPAISAAGEGLKQGMRAVRAELQSLRRAGPRSGCGCQQEAGEWLDLPSEERVEENVKVVDAAVDCSPHESMAKLGDGTLTLIEVPGNDEVVSDRLARKEAVEVGLRTGDVVLLVVPCTAVATEGTRQLLQQVEEHASHALTPLVDAGGIAEASKEDLRFAVVLSKCDDAVRQAAADEDEVEEAAEGAEEEATGPRATTAAAAPALIGRLKARMRATLEEQWGQKYPHTAAQAPIFAISAANLQASRESGSLFDWPRLEQFLHILHEHGGRLSNRRRVMESRRIAALGNKEIAAAAAASDYPQRAAAVLAQHEKEEEEQKQSMGLRRALYGSLALAGAGVCVAGGVVALGAYGAYAGAVATASASSEAAAAAWLASTAAAATAAEAAATATATAAAGTAVSFGVASLAGMAAAVGGGVATAVGAEAADGAIMASPEYRDIVEGSYEDTLRASDGRVVYVGSFKGRMPHGKGRAYWPNGIECLIGEFRDGRFHGGQVLDEKKVLVGAFRMEEVDGLILDGWQPASQVVSECCVCCTALSMAAVRKCFQECGHGAACEGCAATVLRRSAPAKCPICSTTVTQIVRFK